MKTVPGMLLACMVLWADSTTKISGNILDPSGSSIPAAAVSLRCDGVSAKSVRTAANGHYEFVGMRGGTCSVVVLAPGFARYESAPIQLSATTQTVVDVQLTIASESQQVTVSDVAKLDVDPSGNAGALVLTGEDLEALPDDRDDLATDLAALAGPAAGPNGAQMFIDGFTGGRLPSKQSIREIRINQNPFAAQFDKPGQGRIEIFTKPGADDFHGEVQLQFSDALFNSRNPFVAIKPPYQRRQWEGEVTGPVTKKVSFFMDFERRDITENAFVNAVTLNGPLSQAATTPLTGTEVNLKLDSQLSKNHTLTAKYGVQRDTRENQGVGGVSLLSRAYSSSGSEDTLQFIETGVLNLHTVNETRVRFRRQNSDQDGGTSAPTITVLDSFSAGGSSVGNSYDHQKRYELQNFTSWSSGQHLARFGGLMRGVTLGNRSMQNYSGTYTFTTLDNYRLGVPSQFSIRGGESLATLSQFDFGFFVQDDWRIRPNLTLSGGVRYEFQTKVDDHTSWGPRLGFAWAPRRGGKASKQVVRGGFGLFYDRIPESLSLDAFRQDGIRQQQFLISNPTFYPAIPGLQSLIGAAQPQTIRRIDRQWQAPMLMQAAIGYERQLTNGITVATNYIRSTGTHALRSRNITAPAPLAVYLYESSGVYRQNQWITNVNAKVTSRLTLSGFYAYGSARSNTDGAGTFPANQFDLSNEFGRAGFDVRHRMQLNGTITPKWGVRLSPFITLATGRPYNFVTGTDNNRDGIYNDRPSFATDLARPSVVRTPYGYFDAQPVPGQVIVPRNFGSAPGLIAVNLRVAKTFDLGHSDKSKKSDPKQLTFGINARNLLNHPNLAPPTSNLSSVLFLQSTSLAGGQGVVGTRRIDLQVKFAF